MSGLYWQHAVELPLAKAGAEGASISLREVSWLGRGAGCAQAFMCVPACASVCVLHR